MYAVIKTGGKQYRVAEGDVIRIELLKADEGATVDFEEVLLVSNEGDVKVGAPLVDGGKVSAEVVRHGKSDKVTGIKFKRRHNYKRVFGHRQDFTEVKITGISA